MADDTSGLLYNIAGSKSMASGFASIANSFINYNALKIEANNLNLQADAVELQAQQNANNLRKQFISAIGDANYNAAARGVKITSANLQDNIQKSAGELDEDVRKSKKNASMQAANLRTQSKIMKRTAKAQRFSGIMSGISDIAMGTAMLDAGGAFSENMSGQSSGWNPATSAPARKPGR